MTLLALGAMVVAVVVVGSVALPLVAEPIVGGERDEGADLAEAAGAAMRQANDVGHSFGRLIPARAEAAGEGDGDGRVREEPGSPPVSDRADGPDDDARHEVAAALAALASVDGGQADIDAHDRINANNRIDAHERIAAIEALQDAWGPRYRQAEAERRRLAYRIEHAERAARRYFQTQTELTGRIKDPAERSHAQAADLAEKHVYARWRDQAHRTRAQADSIMNDLHDLDVRISKQLLSANFASVHRDFLELPIAIGDLHRDLERFRIRSEEIGAAFGGN